MTNLAYGIDFGTTNSTIAVVDSQGSLQKIPIDPKAENPSVMRSIIYANKEGKLAYGKPAIEAYGKDVEEGKGRVKKTIFTGRYITVAGDADIHGVRPDEVVEELIEFDEFQGGRMLQALKSVLANKNIVSINLFGTIYPIEEVVGGLLKEMKKRADREIHEDVKSVVIGRPVTYVGSDQKLAIERMQRAAKFAGFEDVVFEYEPIAAAYDYGNRIDTKQTVLIFDFGGGTLDVSVVRFPEKKVLANVGLPLGGDFFNSRIFTNKLAVFFGSETHYGPNKAFMPGHIYLALRNWYQATLLKDEKFDEQMDHFRFMSSDEKAIDALRSLVNNNLSFSLYDEIDRVKRRISDISEVALHFEADHIDIKTKVSRNDFEKMIVEDMLRINELLDKALKEADVKAKEIDAVATTGGSSLIPIVRALLVHKFGAKKIIKSDAFTSVAAGLALRAKEVFS